jgi:ribosomal-protein-alanine N-acetyltransferase
MNALAQPLCSVQTQLVPLGWDDLDRILPIEQQAYSHPWSRQNFADSLTSGYSLQGLEAQGQLLGYFVLMPGVDEAHLLNITVDPVYQGQGLAKQMLDILTAWARARTFQWVWLEVRLSNTHAQAVYRHYGFMQVGRRPRYYPAGHAGFMGGEREDALVMSFRL